MEKKGYKYKTDKDIWDDMTTSDFITFGIIFILTGIATLVLFEKIFN